MGTWHRSDKNDLITVGLNYLDGCSVEHYHYSPVRSSIVLHNKYHKFRLWSRMMSHIQETSALRPT